MLWELGRIECKCIFYCFTSFLLNKINYFLHIYHTHTFIYMQESTKKWSTQLHSNVTIIIIIIITITIIWLTKYRDISFGEVVKGCMYRQTGREMIWWHGEIYCCNCISEFLTPNTQYKVNLFTCPSDSVEAQWDKEKSVKSKHEAIIHAQGWK